eukprot:3665078-Amphidinium_carterae.1
MISGRQAIVACPASPRPNTTEVVLRMCCERLGNRATQQVIRSMCLVRGDDVVAAGTLVDEWPGIQAPGEISEYHLVVQQS